MQKEKDEDARSAIPIVEVPLKKPPVKIFKLLESSSMSSRAIFNASSKVDIWVRCHWGVLSFNGKVTLQNGDKLPDKHMQFAKGVATGTTSTT